MCQTDRDEFEEFHYSALIHAKDTHTATGTWKLARKTLCGLENDEFLFFGSVRWNIKVPLLNVSYLEFYIKYGSLMNILSVSHYSYKQLILFWVQACHVCCLALGALASSYSPKTCKFNTACRCKCYHVSHVMKWWTEFQPVSKRKQTMHCPRSTKTLQGEGSFKRHINWRLNLYMHK